MPERLSATGCIDSTRATRPPEGLFPYDVNVPQWADGAVAERYLSVPEGTALRTAPDGKLVLPRGSIAMRTVSMPGGANGQRRLLETQLVLARPDDAWDLYTYVWNEAQTDATLAQAATTIALPGGRTHVVADRAGCVSCHSGKLAPTIGLEAAQLDRNDVDYGGGRLGNPLATLEKLKLLDAPVAKDVYGPLPRLDGWEPASRRARAYLHANCAFCHRGGEGALDLRFGVPVSAMHACRVPGSAKAQGRSILVPRAPDESELVRVMSSTGPERMPPVGAALPNEEANRVVASWIASLSGCE
jgi:hypothetical protein